MLAHSETMPNSDEYWDFVVTPLTNGTFPKDENVFRRYRRANGTAKPILIPDRRVNPRTQVHLAYYLIVLLWAKESVSYDEDTGKKILARPDSGDHWMKLFYDDLHHYKEGHRDSFIDKLVPTTRGEKDGYPPIIDCCELENRDIEGERVLKWGESEMPGVEFYDRDEFARFLAASNSPDAGKDASHEQPRPQPLSPEARKSLVTDLLSACRKSTAKHWKNRPPKQVVPPSEESDPEWAGYDADLKLLQAKLTGKHPPLAVVIYGEPEMETTRFAQELAERCSGSFNKRAFANLSSDLGLAPPKTRHVLRELLRDLGVTPDTLHECGSEQQLLDCYEHVIKEGPCLVTLGEAHPHPEYDLMALVRKLLPKKDEGEKKSGKDKKSEGGEPKSVLLVTTKAELSFPNSAGICFHHLKGWDKCAVKRFLEAAKVGLSDKEIDQAMASCGIGDDDQIRALPLVLAVWRACLSLQQHKKRRTKNKPRPPAKKQKSVVPLERTLSFAISILETKRLDKLFYRLAIFPGHFSLLAVERVLDIKTERADELIKLIKCLSDLRLLREERKRDLFIEGNSFCFYSLIPGVRRFISKQDIQTKFEKRIRDRDRLRYCLHYAALLAAAGICFHHKHPTGTSENVDDARHINQAESLLDRDHANLIEAQKLTAELDEDQRNLLRIVFAGSAARLSDLYYYPPIKGETWLQEGVEAATTLKLRNVEAILRNALGLFFRQMRDNNGALAEYTKAAAAAESSQPIRSCIDTNVANLERDRYRVLMDDPPQTRFDGAMEKLVNSLRDLTQYEGTAKGPQCRMISQIKGQIQGSIGICLIELGKFPDAEGKLQDRVESGGRGGDIRGRAIGLGNKGVRYAKKSDGETGMARLQSLDQAASYLNTALKTHQNIQSLAGEAAVLAIRREAIQHSDDNLKDAKRYLRQSLNHYSNLCDQAGIELAGAQLEALKNVQGGISPFVQGKTGLLYYFHWAHCGALLDIDIFSPEFGPKKTFLLKNLQEECKIVLANTRRELLDEVGHLKS